MTPFIEVGSNLNKGIASATRLAKAKSFAPSCLRKSLDWAEDAGSGCEGLTAHKTGALYWVQRRPWLCLLPDICACKGIERLKGRLTPSSSNIERLSPIESNSV